MSKESSAGSSFWKRAGVMMAGLAMLLSILLVFADLVSWHLVVILALAMIVLNVHSRLEVKTDD